MFPSTIHLKTGCSQLHDGLGDNGSTYAITAPFQIKRAIALRTGLIVQRFCARHQPDSSSPQVVTHTHTHLLFTRNPVELTVNAWYSSLP